MAERLADRAASNLWRGLKLGFRNPWRSLPRRVIRGAKWPASFIVGGPFPHGTVSFMAPKWRMSGSLLGECNCDWGCPCSFDAPPTNGGCQGVYTWIIDRGVYGEVKLDGLGVALPGTFPGAVHLGHGTQLVLIDGRATSAQRKALEALGKGKAGGPFAVFASVTERWLPTIVAPFDVRLKGIRSVLRVDSGKIYDLALSRIKNPVTGAEEEVYLDKPTGFTAKRSELGMSTVARFKTPGLEFDNSGQYAEFSKFSYTGP